MDESKNLEVTKIKGIVITFCIIGALGGLLFGLDQGFINGSLGFIMQYWKLTLSQGESYASIMLVGAVFGAALSGVLSRFIGRKNTILVAAFVFSFFTLWGTVTHHYEILYWTRFCIGLAVGSASYVVPLYLSEIAPTRVRGSMIAVYQLFVTVGICLIYISNAYIGAKYHSWRMMLGIIVIPSVIMFVLTFFIAKSPRWLMLKGEREKAISILEKTLSTKQEIETEINEITQSLERDKKIRTENPFSHFKKGFFIKALLLGISLMVMQQLTGINAIIYYSTNIFAQAGVTNPAMATVLLGVVNVIFTLLGVKLIDKYGRKPLLYSGLGIVLVTLIIMGVCFLIKDGGIFVSVLMLSATLAYIIGAAFSLGPIAWVICAEVFPLECRELGLSITTLFNWAFIAIIVRYSLSAIDVLGAPSLFFIFAVIALLSIIITIKFVPETKGVSLEHLEKNLRKGVRLRDLGKQN